jgi:hypothetical protein
MRMTTFSWVVTLALAMVAIALRQEITEIVAPHPRNNALQDLGAPPSNALLSGRELSGDPRLAMSKEPPLANVINSDKPAVKSQPLVKSRDRKNPDVSAPTAVEGRAFPVSEAIEIACQRLRDYICNDVQEKLSEMSHEPRDSKWAGETEALIEHDILFGQEPGRFAIRDIECRTTLCAAEVESNFSENGTYGGYMGGMAVNHDELNAALHTNFSTVASENNSTGARVIVTLITFTRR